MHGCFGFKEGGCGQFRACGWSGWGGWSGQGRGKPCPYYTTVCVRCWCIVGATTAISLHSCTLTTIAEEDSGESCEANTVLLWCASHLLWTIEGEMQDS